MIVKNFMGGGQGESAEIFITGLASTDSVSATKPSGGSVNAVWKSKPRLPQGFQEVEWIQSSGTQYINTDVKITNNYLKIDCNYMHSTTQYNVQLFGITNSADTQYGISQYFNGYSTNPNTAQFWAGTSGVLCGYTSTSNENHHLIVEVTNGVFYRTIDGSLISASYSGALITEVELLIFDSSKGAGGRCNRGSSIRYYDFKIYDNAEQLARNYIPCYCTESKTGYKGSTSVSVPSNTVGLYDLVNDRFYVNCGSGVDFTKGNDVNYYGWSIPCTEYGTYTVSASNGSKTITESVLVDACEVYEIEMSFLVVRNGDFASGDFTDWTVWSGGSPYGVSQVIPAPSSWSASYMAKLNSDADQNSSISQDIDFTGASQIIMTAYAYNNGTASNKATVRIDDNVIYSFTNESETADPPARIVTIPISVSGTHTLTFYAYKSGSLSSPTRLYISNIYVG